MVNGSMGRFLDTSGGCLGGFSCLIFTAFLSIYTTLCHVLIGVRGPGGKEIVV